MSENIFDLRVDHARNPIGIDAKKPRFSWKLKSEKREVIQRSYQIVAFTDNRKIWDSGTVISDQSLGIYYEGEPLTSRQIVSWQVKVYLIDGEGSVESVLSDWQVFEMGIFDESDWKAKWIEAPIPFERDERQAVNYLRRDFEVSEGLVKARLYQTAHGLYESWINSQETSQDKFKPGLTSYYHRLQYQIHDITTQLQTGKNAWTVQLADGWWRGTTGGTVQYNFGYSLQYFGQIELEYENGNKEVIGTDSRFQYSKGGLLASDMMMGDVYDARLEPTAWHLPDFNHDNWDFVVEVSDKYGAELIPNQGVPVREKEHFKAQVFNDAQGNTVLDFGQNIAGYVSITLRNTQSGQKIRLVHGEDIKDGVFSLDNISHLGMDVEAFQEVTYICKGEKIETYCPRFSIFGFRYVLLEGYDETQIEVDDFEAIAVYSEMDETGKFFCSDSLLNKLVSNSLWSQKGNFMDVPTDCPTRERNAWTGDAQIYTPTATKFMDVYRFFEKWLVDQSIEQYASGKLGITFPSTSSVHNTDELAFVKERNSFAALAGPTGDGNIGEDSAGWGDSAVWIPYMLYLEYGDKKILKNHYQTAKKWVDYMIRCAKKTNPLYQDQAQYHHYGSDGKLDADYIYDTRMHYGEWMEPIEKEKKEEDKAAIFMRMIREGKPLVATAYLYRSSKNLAHIAEILKNSSDRDYYSDYADKVKSIYNRYFIGKDGVIEPGHQAAYVRVLAMNLVEREKKELVLHQLLKEIEANDYRLNTGFLSTPFLLSVLVDNGCNDIAFRLLLQTKSPSWLHPVTLGSTTNLETWFGLERHEESFNHYSYGAVCQFLFEYVAGIRPTFDSPGYKHFHLKPTPSSSLAFAKANLMTHYGKIISEWEYDGTTGLYRCEIPVNTTATLSLPNGVEKELGSGCHEFAF